MKSAHVSITLCLLLAGSTILSFPRLSFANTTARLASLDTSSAQSLWQSRDMMINGYFIHLDHWPNTNIITDLTSQHIPFVELTQYYAHNVESYDIFLDQTAYSQIQSQLNQPLSLNQPTQLIIENNTWLIALYDRKTAERVNGLFDYTDNTGQYWLHMTRLN